MENNNMFESLKKYRRDLHQIPELGFEEYKTKEYLLNVLEEYNCEITEIKTAILAFFEAKKARYSGTVAFRCDMDGLPTIEESNVSYRSKHPGIMHACGHDGHMAMLLGLAGELENIDLPYNVLLIFQPAEESPGGAKTIVESEILEKYDVKRIFALHLGPSKKPHTIASRPIEFMSKSSEIDITIKGLSAHCSTPHKGIDALYIACLYLKDLYEMEKTILPETEFRLLKFGKMTSGTVRNAISDESKLFGTLRCFSQKNFDLMLNSLHQIAATYEDKFGCTFEIKHTEGYPPTINDPELFEMAKGCLSEDFDFITLRKPSMASDDFSFFTEKIPGVYFFLGAGNTPPLHSNNFDFDESVLVTGVKAYIKLLELPL